LPDAHRAAKLYGMLDTWMARNPWLRDAQARAATMLHDGGIRANHATVAAAALGTLAGLAFASRLDAAGVAVLWVSGALDALDGTIARKFEHPSAMGGVLDLCGDRLVEAAALLGIVWPRPFLTFSALMVLASWYVNITVFLAVGAALGAGEKLIDYPPGVVERMEALVFFTLLIVIGHAGVYLCYGYAALELWTAVQRLNFARHRLQSER
jgi:archaetidylinositol phosphate synthase